MEFVSWDDDIPNMMAKIKFMFQTTNQLWIGLVGKIFTEDRSHFLGVSGVNKFPSSNSVKAPANRFPGGGCELIRPSPPTTRPGSHLQSASEGSDEVSFWVKRWRILWVSICVSEYL